MKVRKTAARIAAAICAIAGLELARIWQNHKKLELRTAQLTPEQRYWL